ncbi:MAG: extracellular solute-binding protein [Pirellulales bacterium]|nr:extracellular solute-binding protein [Pirellulales bacterium]
MNPNQFLFHCMLAGLAITCGCAGPPEQQNRLVLATTTSARDSGLLDMVLPRFKDETGIDVQVIAVGTGQALQLGRRGDADILLTHAPTAEKQFVDEGYAHQRHPIMSNDFLLAGPKSDPAAIGGTTTIRSALEKIAQQETPFISRGDGSGTHLREQEAWRHCGISPRGTWYVEAGSGMAATLRMASDMDAYTLCDRGTFLAQQEHLDLKLLCEHDPSMQNEYAAMIVSRSKYPHVNGSGAQQLVEFLSSPKIKKLIEVFGIAQYGSPLFVPAGHEPLKEAAGP